MKRLSSIALAALTLLAGCSTTKTERRPITLLTYDSFVLSKGILEGFTKQTGIPVKVVTQGDAGELVNAAILTKADAESGVLWGVDSTLLTRAVKEKLFVPYTSKNAKDIDQTLRALAPSDVVTPVDRGDVCVNYDKAALAKAGVPAPTTLNDLVDPKYRGMLVVQSPATSSPGLAFLLATIAAFGEDPATGWTGYWKKLTANDVKVVSGWTEAYETWFSAGTGKGDRPLVVSYGTSPAAAVLFGPDPKATASPTGVMTSSCYRQVEFAGILRGKADALDESQELIDFLTGPVLQNDIQLNNFVYPANTKVSPAKEFALFGVRPDDAAELSPTVVDAGREGWIDTWNEQFG
jgi:thiamine transport system substrate-binding protein